MKKHLGFPICAMVVFGMSGCSEGNKESLQKKSEDKEYAELMNPSPAGATNEEIKAHTAKINAHTEEIKEERKKLYEGKNDAFSVSMREMDEKEDRDKKDREAALKEEKEQEYSWRYDKAIDKMTSKETRFAHLKSVNELNFKAPYDGGSYGSLMVRQRKSDGLMVLFSISNGQMICHSSCSLSVRFDDKPSMKFTASTPADYSSTSVFLSPASKFVSELKKSKKIIIEGNYYQSGSQISEFKTENFEWN